MSQIITATFEGGILKPDQQLDLPAHARVRLIVEPLDLSSESAQEAWNELEQLCEEAPIDSAGKLMTRDQLHERH